MSSSAVLTNPSVERVRAPRERIAKAAADFLGCGVAQNANSLVFRAEASGTPVLVMSSGACRVDTGAAGGHPHTVFRLTCPQLLSLTGGREAELAA